MPEPWLRGTLTGVPVLARAALHALELAREDVERWCVPLEPDEFDRRPHGLPSVAFHLKHTARSLDRLLTYAEGRQLHQAQVAALNLEQEPGTAAGAVLMEFSLAMEDAVPRIGKLALLPPDTPRGVGRKELPTTVGGLLVHIADHTQRHIGQAITTAKLVVALRST